MTESEDHFRSEIEAVDLPVLGTDFAIPIFVFEGALDNIAPVPPLTAYMDSITAPRKELVVTANAGHNFMITESAEFLRLLVERVRPLASEPEQPTRSTQEW
jgi:pimeloyl-ACP methyl ester carboxylesterase